MWRARALIDLAALRHNLLRAKTLAGSSEVYAVVKADGYGHGIENIVPTAAKFINGLAVATIDEGIRCRTILSNSYPMPIVVLSEFNCIAQLDIFRQHGMTLVIHSVEQAEWLVRYMSKDKLDRQRLRFWIKIDTGMNRLGLGQPEYQHVIEMLHSLQGTELAGIMSHLANADDVNDQQSLQQIALHHDIVSNAAISASIANSAGLINWPDSVCDMVRPGLLVYGITPDKSLSGAALELKPVMTLQSRLIAVKPVSKDMVVGYGGTWRAKRDGYLGIVGFGYADGYPRAVSNRGYAMVNGQKAPLVGRVSMDMLTVDLGETARARVGDVVELWGQSPGVEEVASWAGTIPYELLCRVSSRVNRQIIN